MDVESVNKAIVDNLAQAVTLTITKWEILPNAQTVRMTATGTDGKTYITVLPTIMNPGVRA